MQIPLRFVFVYSFRLYDQNYTTIPSSFSELIGYLSKIICYGDIFNILIDSKSLFWTVEMTECGFG